MGCESNACGCRTAAAKSSGKYDMHADVRPAAAGVLGLYGDAKLAVYSYANSNLTTSNALAFAVVLLEITKYFK